MAYLDFTLEGDMALWRNPYEPVGSYSSLGPAPSQIAGIIGAAMGFASPRSYAATDVDSRELNKLRKKGLVWPVSPDLLRWQEEEDYSVACKWCGGFPKRFQWNVNGYKALSGGDSEENLRLMQTVVDSPKYEVLVRLQNMTAAQQVASALRQPSFPLYLGTSFCKAIVQNIEVAESIGQIASDENPWAYWVEDLTIGEAVPFSRHIVNDRDSYERIASYGFWVYPTPAHPPPENSVGSDPCVRGYARIE